MNRRRWLSGAGLGATAVAIGRTTSARPAPAAPSAPLRGTGDLGIIIERADGAVRVIDTSARSDLGVIEGLGDLSHASAVFSRCGRYGFVFGRDGGLTRIDLLERRIVARVIQSGNAIGGSISQDGATIAVANYRPGGVQLFDSTSLERLAEVPATAAPAGDPASPRSKVVGIADAPGHRFVCTLFDAGQIWLIDCQDRRHPRVTVIDGIGRLPYDALITPDGRHYVAGLYGEPGAAVVDLWQTTPTARRVLPQFTREDRDLPVYKMPHLRGWAQAGRRLYLPAIGRHEVWRVDADTFEPAGAIPVSGQPVFAIARPDGRQVWVNFALPDNDRIDVIDTLDGRVIRTLRPGRAILHLEFTPRGEHVWLSARDDDRILVIDTGTLETVATLPARQPSGIFFTSRATRIGL